MILQCKDKALDLDSLNLGRDGFTARILPYANGNGVILSVFVPTGESIEEVLLYKDLLRLPYSGFASGFLSGRAELMCKQLEEKLLNVCNCNAAFLRMCHKNTCPLFVS